MSRRTPSFVDLLVPVLVTVVVVAGSVAHSGGVGVAPLILAAAAGLSLFARRRAPAATLAVSGVLTVLVLHLEPAAGATTVIAPAVALYSLALRSGTATRVIAAVAAVAAVVVADRLHGGTPSLLQTCAHVLLVAIPLLIADVHRTRHANVALLKERLALAERTREQEAERRAEQERLRIARDLHDVVAHTLTTINVQASTAAELLDRNPEHARDALETIENASRDAIDELRAIVGVLREPDTTDAPLRPAPGIDDLPELVKRTHEDGVEVRMAIVGDAPRRLPEAVSLAAYRIVQECLTNARRHASGSAVQVTLAFEPDRVGVTVENGEGTPEDTNGHSTGVGILGMRERAAAVGGSLNARTIAQGFRVDAGLPYGAP